MSLRAAYVHRNLVYGVSIGGAIVVSIIVALLDATGHLTLPFSAPTTVILIILLFLIFPNFMEFSYQRWRRRIDDAIPGLLTDISAQVKTGITLDRSLEIAATKDYGPLTDELKKLQTQLQLGVPFEEAVDRLIKRVKTTMVKRTFGLIVQANRAGGKIEELLDIIQSDANELFLLDKERRSALRPYVVVIYIAFGVFVAVSVLLVDSFFKQVLGSGSGTSVSFGSGNGLAGLTLPAVKDLFLQMALIEAIFGGFGAGKLGEGSFTAGFKHVLIMAGFTLLVFVVIV
ncbi:MAG: type II secretion system F family protein [Thaumarchaeota archaeon]|nr:type II secretion system F family protein [Nitrososphaerota archaeon]